MLAAVGGVLIAITIGKLNPFIGFLAGIKAFTAAVLGGIGSIPGAMLGGVLLGLAETLAAAYISSQYKDIVAFALLVLILLFRSEERRVGKECVRQVRSLWAPAH